MQRIVNNDDVNTSIICKKGVSCNCSFSTRIDPGAWYTLIAERLLAEFVRLHLFSPKHKSECTKSNTNLHYKGLTQDHSHHRSHVLAKHNFPIQASPIAKSVKTGTKNAACLLFRGSCWSSKDWVQWVTFPGWLQCFALLSVPWHCCFSDRQQDLLRSSTLSKQLNLQLLSMLQLIRLMSWRVE